MKIATIYFAFLLLYMRRMFHFALVITLSILNREWITENLVHYLLVNFFS